MPPELSELLQPIPGDQPGGTDHAGNPEFLTLQTDVKRQRREVEARMLQEAQQRRLTELSQNPNADQNELKTIQQSLVANPVEPGPGWKKLRDVAERLLVQRTKDLEVAAYWTEASCEIDGFAGFAKGIALITGLLDTFWDKCFPPLSADGDDFRRWSKLLAVNSLGGVLERQALLTLKTAEGTRPFTFFEWKLASGRQAAPKGLSGPALEDWQKRVSAAEEAWDRIGKSTGADELNQRAALLNDCVAAMQKLQETVTAKFKPAEAGDDPREFGSLIKDLETCRRLLAELISGAGEANAEAGGAAAASDGAGAASGSGGGARGAVGGRAEAVRRLREIAAYFRTAEPNSPVSFLLERAIKWADLPFDALMRDMMDNGDAIAAIDRLLGIKQQEQQHN